MKRIILLILFIFICINAKSQDKKLRSIFIYNFARYMVWPIEYREGNFIIGIVGTSLLNGELKKFTEKRKIGAQIIEIKRLSVNDLAETNCHIIYLPYKKSSSLGEIIKIIEEKPTLVVTEENNLFKNGADISFLEEGNKQRFQLNIKNVDKKGIKISSTLKELAAEVN